MRRPWRRIVLEQRPLSEWYDKDPRLWYDCGTVLSVVVQYGAASGYDFTGKDYQTVVTEDVERHLADGVVEGLGDYLLFLHDLVEGGGDMLVFRRGVKEQGDKLLFGDFFVNFCGGTVR